MYDFLTPIGVVGIIFYTVYKLFDLFARRRERIMLIEKLSETNLKDGCALPSSADFMPALGKFTALRFGCLLCGLGLGMLVAYLIYVSNAQFVQTLDYGTALKNTIFSACILLGGGFGLLVSFIVETMMSKPNTKTKPTNFN